MSRTYSTLIRVDVCADFRSLYFQGIAHAYADKPNLSLTSSPTDYIQHIGSTLASLSPCSIPQRLYRQAQSLLRSLLPWSNIASKTGIQYSRTM